MTAYEQQIGAALQAVTVTSATSFAWFGQRSGRLPRPLVRSLAPDSAREILVGGLQDVLYRSFYTQGQPVPAAMSGSPGQSDRAFIDALSRANAGAGGWQSGWRIERVDTGIAQVVRHGLRARVPLAECRGTEALVSVRRPKEAADGTSGFYLALGDVEPSDRHGIEERVYFNVHPEGALRLVAGCTRLLNDAGIPFELKVFDDPASAVRCDAAVLYLERGGFRRAREHLRIIVTACGPHLFGRAPAFTLPLARGVSVGEHAGGLGGSFGSSRCRLLAEGIAAAHERGATRLADRLEIVARRFAQRGLDVQAPYLAPGSTERYEL